MPLSRFGLYSSSPVLGSEGGVRSKDKPNDDPRLYRRGMYLTIHNLEKLFFLHLFTNLAHIDYSSTFRMDAVTSEVCVPKLIFEHSTICAFQNTFERL